MAREITTSLPWSPQCSLIYNAAEEKRSNSSECVRTRSWGHMSFTATLRLGLDGPINVAVELTLPVISSRLLPANQQSPNFPSGVAVIFPSLHDVVVSASKLDAPRATNVREEPTITNCSRNLISGRKWARLPSTTRVVGESQFRRVELRRVYDRTITLRCCPLLRPACLDASCSHYLLKE